VTRHILDGRAAFRVRSNEILLRKGLSIPDGVAVNTDRRWISVSNHNSHSVLLFENTPRLNRRSEPLGILSGVNYPHGVLFSPDDRFVVVADAGTPNVRIYAKDGGSWQGLRYPVKSVRVMDDQTFLRGRKNPEEGGPKGIDVDSHANVLVTTSTEQTLAFYDMPRLLNP
jgi:DNA-binding beta-propeller fold protein YncE